MWTEEECKNCQWCCRVKNSPVLGGVEYAYLYYIKGFNVYWEPHTRTWWTLDDMPCQHIGDGGCKIQCHKPRICREWYCPFGPTFIHTRYDILLEAGQRIMRQLEKRGDFK